MRFKLIACEVFHREACFHAARSPHTLDIEFTDKDAHDRSDELRTILQAKIDTAERENRYDAILLCFGICGNSTIGLAASKTRLVIPRAHDCCTLFLGSKEAFRLHFGENPSQPFSSAGYMERGDGYLHDSEMGKSIGLYKSHEEYVELYGEENARYLVETFASSLEASEGRRVVYIEIPETAHLGFAEKCRKQAVAEGKEFVTIEGSTRLIRNLVSGEWDNREFLVLGNGKRIAGVYDFDEIIRAEDASEHDESMQEPAGPDKETR